jgi:hypothetical protein
MVGALLPYEPFKDWPERDKLEPYYDSAFEGIHHHNSLCVLFDGMNGKYVAIGHVIAKTQNWRGFEEPIQVASGSIPGARKLREAIEAIVPPGVEVKLGRFVISHYR